MNNFPKNQVRTKMRVFLVTTLFLAAISPVIANGQQSSASADLTRALRIAADMPRLHSLLVSHDERLVVEEYFNGKTARDAANVKSVSKSIVSALIGIAIDKGHIESLDQPISAYFGELIPDRSGTGRENITIGNLLSMQAGLETTSFYNYGAWVLSDNWIEFALDQPLQTQPGTQLRYSTGNTHLLSAILTQATGKSTLAFAREVLSRPLGFEFPAWTRDPLGIYMGGNNMELTPQQMLRFGELYLREGRADGKQIIPAGWIDTSLQPLIESRREAGRFYGYGWWMRDMAGYETAFAWGYGGQFILLVQELDLVVVATSSSQPGSGRRAHIARLYALLENEIVRVLSNSTNGPEIRTAG